MSAPGLHIHEVVQRWAGGAGRTQGYLDRPQPGERVVGYYLPMSGWIVDERLNHLELDANGQRVSRITADRLRPDIARVMGQAHARSGFAANIRLLGREDHLRLDLVAVDDCGERTPVASVALTTSSFPPPPASSPAPLMITTIGRSGSSWMCALLGAHPAIFTYRPMQAEARVASYWCQIFADLTEPNTVRMPLDPLPTGDLWWRWTPRRGAAPVGDPDVESLLSPSHVHSLGEFCQQRVTATCAAMWEAAGRTSPPRYFTEKCLTNEMPQMIWNLFPNSREILLVRDLRDVLASIIAFNQKRGYAAFGRQNHESDEAYLSEFAGIGWSLHRACASRGDRALIVRYEDLVEDTGEQLVRILGYLGLDADEATVSAILATSPRGERASVHRTTADAHTSIGRWKDDLPPNLRRACDDALAEPIAALGYAVNDSA